MKPFVHIPVRYENLNWVYRDTDNDGDGIRYTVIVTLVTPTTMTPRARTWSSNSSALPSM